jgi:hypothetical protein
MIRKGQFTLGLFRSWGVTFRSGECVNLFWGNSYGLAGLFV